MDYKEKFKGILKDLGYSGKMFAFAFGIDYSYYRKVTQKKGAKIVNWLRMFVIGYEIGLEKGKESCGGGCGNCVCEKTTASQLDNDSGVAEKQ